MAENTTEMLEEIVKNSVALSDIVERITEASRDQAAGVEEVNKGLNLVENVTQANTASAEETASASEELSSQAAHLKSMISRFNLGRDSRTMIPYRSSSNEVRS